MSETRLDITEHFVRAQARYFTERAKLVIAKRGGFDPMFFVVCVESPLDGSALDADTSIVPVMHGGDYSEEAKQNTVMVARSIAIAGRAFAAIAVVNSWAVFSQGDPEKQRKLYEDVTAGRVSIANHPDRTELLVTVIEWRDNSVEIRDALRVERDQGFVDFDPVKEFESSGMHEMNAAFSIMPPKDMPPPDCVVDAARSFAAHVLTDKRVEARKAAEEGRVPRG